MKLCPKCQKQFSDDANFCPVDAARLTPLEGGAVVAGGEAEDPIAARFQLGERLGGSRTGEVRRATDRQGGQVAALKVISSAVIALPGVAPRLERELKQLERVQSAGVARVLASGKRGDDSWLAVEMLDGAQTLAEAIAARGPIPADLAARLIEVVGEALIEAAQVGVVHRDLAPKNVLFAGDDIKLINFSLPVPPAEPGKPPGVADFVAPEQADGKPVDQRSNLYSLGALYYYVLTGQPVQHDDAGAVKPPSTLTEVPTGIEAIILRSLDRSPTKRFLTVRQFVDEVSRVARGEADKPVALGRPKPKAELVQTLLGIRAVSATPVTSETASSAAGSIAPQIQAAPSPIASGVVTAPASAAPSTPSVIVGSGAYDAPPAVAPASAAVEGMPALAMPAAAVEPPTSTTATVPDGLAPLAAAVGVASVAVTGMPALAVPEAAPAPAPVPAAPVVPQPLMAAQLAPSAKKAASPAKDDGGKEGGGGGGGGKDGKKGKFRETMWFKKGELDSEAAQAAAAERARTGKDGANDRTDHLPIDERYKDDGSLSRSDKEKYSLRTGGTQAIRSMRDSGQSKSVGKVSEDELIGEMRGGRTRVIAAIAAGVVLIILIVFLMVTR